MDTLTHWIDGRPVASKSDRSGEVFNPATGDVQKRVPYATLGEIDAAIDSAAKASESWKHASLATRARILFAFRELVNKHKDDLARMLTLEHGKVFSDAQGEVQRGLEVIEFACGLQHLLKGEISENVSTDVDSYSLRQPVGVVAGITPFNFPAMVPMWMYPVAIACGNTFVLKPSERDPSVTNFCAELLAQAGLPEGVLNIVHGDKVAVDRILEHPSVGAVSFVGSTPIARYIYETGTKNGKRVQALGGAKNHMVVLPDADMELAADAAVGAGYGSAGERCMAISVLVCVGNAADKLLPKIRERIAVLKVGNGLEPDSQMGPLITRQHLDKVTGYVNQGEKEGAKVLVDGRTLKVPGHERGFFLGPCLLDEVTPSMTVYREEIFGPVLSVVRVDTYEQAIRLIQEHPYGNGTAIFTNDGGAARKFQHEIQVGMVGINVPIPVPMSYYSFGGWKQSLFGDLHIYGPDGIKFYTRNKVVIGRWPDPRFRGVDLGFPQNR
ncbi:MAG: CoA-acylating methylmalonate-semialdehyde dehydrogenase [Deltaproteobacteria bacterium]|nr:CoA-acylating methylmalonate-semialdehyde dehydrogenase [Deltaproteobacteria bacterium]